MQHHDKWLYGTLYSCGRIYSNTFAVFFFFLWLGESIAEFKNRLNYTRKKRGHSRLEVDSRGSLTTRKCIQSPFRDIFKGGWHRHSSHFAHPGVQSLPGWQSLASQTHLYMQFIETRKAMFLDSIFPTASIGVIAAWAQIHQKTFTPTFSYLLNLAGITGAHSSRLWARGDVHTGKAAILLQG